MNASEIIKQIVEIEKGIIPSCVWYNSPEGINQDRWSSLSSEEKKKSKRKFRKLYRKACRRFDLKYNHHKDPKSKASLVRRYIRELCEESKF